MNSATISNKNWLANLGIVTSDQFKNAQRAFIESCITAHSGSEGNFIGYRFVFEKQEVEMIFEKGVLTYDRSLMIVGASMVHKVN